MKFTFCIFQSYSEYRRTFCSLDFGVSHPLPDRRRIEINAGVNGVLLVSKRMVFFSISLFDAQKSE
jgi:hypothetical protein